MCGWLCVTDLFLSFYSIRAVIRFAPNQFPISTLHRPPPPPPLLYADAYVTPDILQIILIDPACRLPHLSPIVLDARQLPVSLAYGFIILATSL